MKLTQEQRAVVKDDQSRVVSSCPGSGKTRTIIAKVLFCVDQVFGTPRKVGCITYTNSATSEIISRLLEAGATGDDQYYEVNTIHSFCLNNIVRPYGYLIEELSQGVNIAAPDSQWFQDTVASLINKYRLPARVSESFGEIQRRPNGELLVPDGLSHRAVDEFVQLLTRDRYVTFSDIVYYSFRIVKENPFVARALSSRFAWLLVDEFQDTSELQVELLAAIQEIGHTKLFLVGDPNQSIYGFAGARPDLMEEIVGRLDVVSDVSLSGNFRSSECIIDVAEKLCPRTPPMVSLGVAKNFGIPPRHFHTTSAAEAILGWFLPEVERLGIELGDTAILAPWWTSVFPLSRLLRARGIPVLGPGARPYRRSLEFGQFAESAAAYAISKDSDAATTAQRALFFMLLRVNDEPTWSVFSYPGKRILCTLLDVAYDLYGQNIGAVEWLTAFGKTSAEILRKEELVDIAGRDLIIQSVSSMVDSIRRNVSDFENMPIADLGIFARPKQCVELMTLHASKGKEFDAVAVIDFHEGRVPHFSVSNEDTAGIAEALRLTYVAATRARKLLMFFTDGSDNRNRPSRFLGASGMAL